MDEFEKLTHDEFFVIDSLNLSSIKPKLYGFSIFDEKIIENNNIDDFKSVSGNGVYIWIQKTEDCLKIFQDYNGSYGLFLYETEGYFAISNSFIKLVEYLKEIFVLTLNEDYAKLLISVDLASCAYCETLINEISMLPKNYVVNIDLKSKKITYDEINYEDNSVFISSKEGIELLDNWFYRWINIFRYIKSKTNNISFDLSGGFDTRLILTIALNSGIDLNNVEIFSITDNKHTHREDFEIASSIADYFNFKLNKKILNPKNLFFKEIATPINISFYTKLGFHKQMYYRRFISLNRTYAITGAGGAMLRGFWNISPEEYVCRMVNRANYYSPDFGEATKSIINRSFNQLRKRHGCEGENFSLPQSLYKESRSRHHFGKGLVGSYLTNSFKLSPLLDPDLRKLKLNDDKCSDKNLLVAVIFTRYCPKLLEFKFDSGRYIKQGTIDYANEINCKYPFKQRKYDLISSCVSEDIDENIIDFDNNLPIKSTTIEHFIKDVFLSKKFKKLVECYFSEEIYQKIYSKTFKTNFFPLEDVYAIIAVIKIINDINYSKNKDFKTTFDWLTTFENYNSNNEVDLENMLKTKLEKYNTARIDIKNFGSNNNDIKLIHISDFDAICQHPNWFKNNNGSGLIVKSQKNSLELEIECILAGELKIFLRGVDFRLNKNRIPININFTKFVINDNEIFNENKIINHDNPFIFKKDVLNKEKCRIYIEWEPI